MATVQSEGIPVRVLAFAAAGALTAIVGFVLWDGVATDRDHEGRLTELEATQRAVISEINRRLGIIEDELRGR